MLSAVNALLDKAIAYITAPLAQAIEHIILPVSLISLKCLLILAVSSLAIYLALVVLVLALRIVGFAIGSFYTPPSHMRLREPEAFRGYDWGGKRRKAREGAR